MINAFKQIRLSNINLSGSDNRIHVGNSGSLAYAAELDSAVLDFNTQFSELSGRADGASDALSIIDYNVSGLIRNSAALTSGYNAIRDYLPAVSGSLEILSGQSEALFDLTSNIEDRLSGVDDALVYLLDRADAALNPYQQSFSYPIASGYEDYSILFPSGAFDSVPTINVSLESEVGYMFTLRNKTVSGFDIGFSDIIQESGVSIDVFASVKF